MSESAVSEILEPARVPFFATVYEDVKCVFERDPAARFKYEILLTYPGVQALILHRISNRLWLRGWCFPARLISFFSRVFTNVDIHPGATIGKRLFIDHGAGVVIGETAEIGDDVTMYHGSTLGGTTWNKGKRHPTLRDGVMVGAGAKILGPVVIGENARIGANSVVVSNVQQCRTVVGVPGNIVMEKHVRLINPYGIDLNHHLVPDPVGKAIEVLMQRIDDLEDKLARSDNGKNRNIPESQSCAE
jgi:serine O-acetyltransferase